MLLILLKKDFLKIPFFCDVRMLGFSDTVSSFFAGGTNE